MKWYDWTVLLVDVFAVPAILLGFGWLFLKKPPKDINEIGRASCRERV